jgi:hypothetical protein
MQLSSSSFAVGVAFLMGALAWGGQMYASGTALAAMSERGSGKRIIEERIPSAGQDDLLAEAELKIRRGYAL